MKNIHCSSSSLVANYLTTLRDIETSTKQFRDAAAGISNLLIAEATADLPLTKKILIPP
jgi:uracil phosphoribosyltransferase